MLTREQVLDIQTYCAEHKITIGERLGELHIETSQFYRWQRKYRQEDEQGSDPGSFVQLTQGGGKHLLDLHRNSNMGLRCKSKRCLRCVI